MVADRAVRDISQEFAESGDLRIHLNLLLAASEFLDGPPGANLFEGRRHRMRVQFVFEVGVRFRITVAFSGGYSSSERANTKYTKYTNTYTTGV